MYLQLQPLLNRDVSVGDLFMAAVTSSEDVSRLVPAGDPVLQQLQQVQQAGPLFLDVYGADMHFAKKDFEKIVQAIRDRWHQHGFCIARSSDPQRWMGAISDYRQPLLHWRSLSIIDGWNLIGHQLRGSELDVFRLLVSHGATTVERVATNAAIFSQQPNLGSLSVQMDIEMGRRPRGPLEDNRANARRILMHLHDQRIVIERRGFYGIVRPTRENGV